MGSEMCIRDSHHIDDRTNNDLKNLKFLCPNCHSYYTLKLNEVNKLMKQIKRHPNYKNLSQSARRALDNKVKKIKQRKNLESGIEYLKKYIRIKLNKERRGFFDW